jgi:tetratricopeptide (TPR) repeat protein
VLGKEYYTLNSNVGRRYFSQRGINVPEPHDDIFEAVKQKNTRRIFMLGESTMAGFPFDYNATAPQLLHDRLQQLLPQYNVEVINVGLSAVNSYTVREFVQELVHYQPDAFVIYLGHNEFFGALGIGSTEYLGQSATLVNLYLRLNNLYLFRFVRDGIVKLRNLFTEDATPRNATLMEAMVRTKAILFDSREYRTARKNFESNMQDILDIANSAGVPVVLSTLASNVRDRPPFLASFAENSYDSTRERWKEIYTRAMAEEHEAHFSQAIDLFEQAIDIDSMNADAHYFLARCLDTLGRYTEAKAEYARARDYDGLRFRASSDVNRLIRDISSREHTALADVEHAFEQASPHGMVGSNLMFEHLHPTFDGYFLLAKTFFQTIADNGIIGKDFHWDRDLSEDEFRTRAGVTGFDLETARYRIFELTNSWPFRQAGERPKTFAAATHIETLAVTYVHKGIAWSQAHYDLAGWYQQKGEYESARREYFAVAKVVPYSYYPFMMIGDMYRLMEQPAEAESTYSLALTKQQSPFVHVRLGMLYFDQEKIAPAIEQFEASVRQEPESKDVMDAKARSMVQFFLGAAYGKSGNIDKAKAHLQTAIRIDPENAQAKAMLAGIP